MFWTRRNSHLSAEDLSAYSDGELNAARLQSAAAHLASCDECTAALDGLREVSVLVSRLPEAEPSRSFVLTPAMAGSGQQRPQPAPKRQSFVFVPAVALTLLVALFAVDLASSGTSSTTSNDEAATASQAMIAKDASSSADARDSGGGAGTADAPLRSTFAAPVAPTPLPGAIAPSAPSTTGPLAAPNVVPPATGPASTPSSPGEQQPALAPAPTTSGQTTGSVPVPAPSTKPSTESATAPSAGLPPDAPAITGGVTSEAVPAPADIADDSVGGGDGTSMRNSGGLGDDGTDWLRIAEVLTAVVFVASLAYVFGSGLIKKGH